jgi:hypothetical protein
MAATTCSRHVKTKSIWVPGTFTISTLGSSRRTRSMLLFPGEVLRPLGRVPVAYVEDGLN